MYGCIGIIFRVKWEMSLRFFFMYSFFLYEVLLKLNWFKFDN